jgi:hypothetical protein
MNKSSKASTNDRKAPYAWRPTGVANVYMRGTKYYYVKMNRGKRHFVPLADSQGRPVRDLAEAIRAASKVAMNPFVERPESLRNVLNEFFEEKLRKREWEATTKRGHRHIYETFFEPTQDPAPKLSSSRQEKHSSPLCDTDQA